MRKKTISKPMGRRDERPPRSMPVQRSGQDERQPLPAPSSPPAQAAPPMRPLLSPLSPAPPAPRASATPPWPPDPDLADAGDLEALRAMLEEAREQTHHARLEAARSRIAARWRLPEALASRLRGDNEAELEADARALARALPRRAPSAAYAVDESALTVDDVRHMSADEINRRWDDVRRALREG